MHGLQFGSLLSLPAFDQLAQAHQISCRLLSTHLHAGDVAQVMVRYRFDAVPHALQVAIPHTYDGTLFQESDSAEHQQAESAEAIAEQQKDQHTQQQQDERSKEQPEQKQQDELEHINIPLEHGRKVTVVGVSRHPAKKDTYIVAGSATKQSTDEAHPIAVCIDKRATVKRQTGEDVSSAIVPKLHEGETIIVEGKKSKRGVLLAKQVVIFVI